MVSWVNFGWGNVGDEGILQAIMDSLGAEHEYIVYSNLPFNLNDDYRRRLPTVADVRTLDDMRVDYDALILGGGKVDWGFAWSLFFNAFAQGKFTMAYGIALRVDQMMLHHDLLSLYGDFFRRFNAITVRDRWSHELLDAQGVTNYLTVCPAINLKEQKCLTLDGKIAVCPRFGDYNQNGEVDNEAQIKYFVSRLKQEGRGDVLLIPFFPKDREEHKRDLELCHEINRRLGGGCVIFPSTGYNARMVKYAISESKLVISGGRYHAIVWAIAHGIRYEIAPTIGEPALSKLNGIIELDKMCGREKLLAVEHQNKRIFEAMF